MNDIIGTRRGTRKADGSRGGAIGGGGGSNPPGIFGANLIAWYKADTGVTLSGSNVTAWADQSGNSHNLTSVTGAPVFSSSSFNSHQGITFTINDGIATAGFNISSNAASFFIVGNLTTSPGGNERVLSYFDPAGPDFNMPGGILALNNDTAGTINCIQNSVLTSSLTVTSGTNVRLGNVYSGAGGTVVLYLNNAGTSSSGFGNNTLGTALTTLAVNHNAVGSGEAMTVAEIVMTNNAASSGQVSSLDSYFKTKWGL